ncbi:MAG TPA: branched-chain amino acid ABC transporter permease [Stellaceae bacterium]|nr:branched-chain amino acid ABC transporter permease [Stellaceae bacterium]
MNLILDLGVTTATLLLVILGLGIILGLMDVINLAHAGLMAAGVYMALLFASLGSGFAAAVIGATVATAIIGAIIEVVVIRRLYGRAIDDTILATWGVSLILIQSISWIFGREPVGLPVPIPGGIVVFGIDYPAYRLFLVAVAAAMVLALGAVMRFTRLGLTVRMVMTNEVLARGVGIDTVRVRQLTFITGAAIAGAAGALIGPTQGLSPQYGVAFLAPAFLAVLIAGRNLAGLVAASILLGATQVLVTLYANPVYADVVVIVVAVVILRLWPAGFTWRRA